MSEKLNLIKYTRQTVKEYLETTNSDSITDLHKLAMGEIEKGLITEVLLYCEGNQRKASKILGITRTTLRSKIRKHQLQ